MARGGGLAFEVFAADACARQARTRWRRRIVSVQQRRLLQRVQQCSQRRGSGRHVFFESHLAYSPSSSSHFVTHPWTRSAEDKLNGTRSPSSGQQAFASCSSLLQACTAPSRAPATITWTQAFVCTRVASCPSISFFSRIHPCGEQKCLAHTAAAGREEQHSLSTRAAAQEEQHSRSTKTQCQQSGGDAPSHASRPPRRRPRRCASAGCAGHGRRRRSRGPAPRRWLNT